MISIASFIHYFSVILPVVSTGLGVSLGQGITSKAAFDAINRQPDVKKDINKAALLSLAFIETAGIFGFMLSILLFFQNVDTLYQSISQLGVAFAISITGFIISLVSAMPASFAIISISRQPFISKKIFNLMVLSQSLIQTPLAFSFIIALLIRNQVNYVTTLDQAIALLASGLCIGLGSIGPGVGVGIFTKSACQSTGINSHAYSKLVTFTVISQAIIETPVIFSSIISFLLLRGGYVTLNTEIFYIVYLAAAFVMAIGALGPSIASGRVAAVASKQIAYDLSNYGTLARASLIAQGIIDTGVIYAFIVSLTLMFNIRNFINF